MDFVYIADHTPSVSFIFIVMIIYQFRKHDKEVVAK